MKQEPRASCFCGDEHEPYDGYRNCHLFHQKIKWIAYEEQEEPIHILSTGKWKKDVDKEKLGLIDEY